jgi:hypothetical protein
MYLLFTASMVAFYSLVSLVMRRSSALLFNISVLTSDFYSLLAGVFVFGQNVNNELGLGGFMSLKFVFGKILNCPENIINLPKTQKILGNHLM